MLEDVPISYPQTHKKLRQVKCSG